jgi:O-acetylserine/cysteine efflux transporter
MSAAHHMLALLIATVWGLTFVSMKFALQDVPPFALSAWRFFLAAFPLLFFVGKPQAPWRWLVAYGFFIAIGQFVVMFIALKLGMPAGLMSLVVQTQVFLTIGLAVFFFRESITRAQLIGALVAAAGLVVIGSSKLKGGIGLAFMLVLFAAFCWACGNTIAKHVARVRKTQALPPIQAMNFIAWTSACAVPALVAISLFSEPTAALLIPVTSFSWTLSFHLIVMAYAAQVFGYGLWANLLTRYPASAVMPFALWVPVAGFSATAWAFGERLNAAEITGSMVVLTGLAIAVLVKPKAAPSIPPAK